MFLQRYTIDHSIIEMDTGIDRELRTKISSASSDEDEKRSPFFSTLTSSFMLTKMQTKVRIRFGPN